MPERKKTIAIYTFGGGGLFFEADLEHWQLIKRALWNKRRFSIATEDHGEFFFAHVTVAQYSVKELPNIPRISGVLLQRSEP